jgi:hypothetical protein
MNCFFSVGICGNYNLGGKSLKFIIVSVICLAMVIDSEVHILGWLLIDIVYLQ